MLCRCHSHLPKLCSLQINISCWNCYINFFSLMYSENFKLWKCYIGRFDIIRQHSVEAVRQVASVKLIYKNKKSNFQPHQFYIFKTVNAQIGCAGSVTDIVAENGIGQAEFKFRASPLCSLPCYVLGKDMDPYLMPTLKHGIK